MPKHPLTLHLELEQPECCSVTATPERGWYHAIIAIMIVGATASAGIGREPVVGVLVILFPPTCASRGKLGHCGRCWGSARPTFAKAWADGLLAK